jgi:transcription initiation factor TFIIIB Brf1 subunit/transcription initiation factor TFIIB
MKSHVPYKKEQVHHEISSGGSYIGTQKERFNHQQLSKLERMQKLQQQRSYEYHTQQEVEIQIIRILSGLNLPYSFKTPILRSFKKLKATLHTRKYILEKYVPLLVYFYCRKQGIPISEQKLMNLTNMGKKEYDRYKLKLIDLMILKRHRNRKKLIKSKLFRLSKEFDLGMDFYYDALHLLKVLWKDIYCTKDDVIAGLVSSVAVLCHYRNKVTINSLCKRLHIAMSTI